MHRFEEDQPTESRNSVEGVPLSRFSLGHDKGLVQPAFLHSAHGLKQYTDYIKTLARTISREVVTENEGELAVSIDSITDHNGRPHDLVQADDVLPPKLQEIWNRVFWRHFRKSEFYIGDDRAMDRLESKLSGVANPEAIRNLNMSLFLIHVRVKEVNGTLLPVIEHLNDEHGYGKEIKRRMEERIVVPISEKQAGKIEEILAKDGIFSNLNFNWGKLKPAGVAAGVVCGVVVLGILVKGCGSWVHEYNLSLEHTQIQNVALLRQAISRYEESQSAGDKQFARESITLEYGNALQEELREEDPERRLEAFKILERWAKEELPSPRWIGEYFLGTEYFLGLTNSARYAENDVSQIQAINDLEIEIRKIGYPPLRAEAIAVNAAFKHGNISEAEWLRRIETDHLKALAAGIADTTDSSRSAYLDECVAIAKGFVHAKQKYLVTSLYYPLRDLQMNSSDTLFESYTKALKEIGGMLPPSTDSIPISGG